MKISIYIANKKYKYLSSYRKVQYIDDMDREYETKTITSNKILEYINLMKLIKNGFLIIIIKLFFCGLVNAMN